MPRSPSGDVYASSYGFHCRTVVGGKRPFFVAQWGEYGFSLEAAHAHVTSKQVVVNRRLSAFGFALRVPSQVFAERAGKTEVEALEKLQALLDAERIRHLQRSDQLTEQLTWLKRMALADPEEREDIVRKLAPANWEHPR